MYHSELIGILDTVQKAVKLVLILLYFANFT